MTINLSWDDMLDVASSQARHPTANQSITKGRSGGFHATENYGEALELLRHGWAEGLRKIAVSLAANPPAVAPQPVTRYDVAGFRPHVQRYIAGDPFCMVARGEDNDHKPTVRLMVNGFLSSGNTKTQRLNQGMGLVQLVDQLERQGRRVELVIYFYGSSWSRVAPYDIRITVKEAGEPVELDRIAFAFMHVDFFRRIGFGLIERFYDQKKDFGSYGSPADVDVKTLDADTVLIPCMNLFTSTEYATPAAALATLTKHCEAMGVQVEGEVE
jgi:hypothetical protein